MLTSSQETTVNFLNLCSNPNKNNLSASKNRRDHVSKAKLDSSAPSKKELKHNRLIAAVLKERE